MLTDEASFDEISRKILGIHFLSGAVPQIAYPLYTLQGAMGGGEGASVSGSDAQPMVSIQGLDKQAVEARVGAFNAQQRTEAEHVHLAIINAYDSTVVAGELTSVAGFVNYLHQKQDEDGNKSNGSSLSTVYLKITAPYHCVLLQESIGPMLELARENGWLLDHGAMQLEVRALDDGHDIRNGPTEDDLDLGSAGAADWLTRYMLQSLCVLRVDWPRAVEPRGETTHIVDFGPGGLTGFGSLAHRSIEGSGVAVLCAGVLTPSASHAQLGTRGDIYQHRAERIVRAANWAEEFRPRLVRLAESGEVHLDTRMHRMLGKPTVMVGGMTPTTANTEFVAAISNAGYHVELAGGGMHSAEDMERKVLALAKAIPGGHGITVNCIYINPKQWSFQLPTLLRLRETSGAPIAGLCIGGGVPSLETAIEVIDSLRSAGIRHLALKPSSAAAIRQVVQIAQASGGFPIVCQWTGGRAGGHHSLADFHAPLLETYAAVRACRNVALVVGSGFGDAHDTLPYITGEWSARFGRAPMPVDGVLLASRVMVARESLTGRGAKELIAAAPGITDAQWMAGAASGSGIASLTSELGERNHSLATRAVRMLCDLRESVLDLPRAQQQAALDARRAEIIARLDADYMRPWFARSSSGVCELEEMTYTEVIERLVELTYVRSEARWAAQSFRRRVLEFVDRAERRLADVAAPPDCSAVKVVANGSPLAYADSLAALYPRARTLRLAAADAQFFVASWRAGGQQPAPFIASLDASDFAVALQKSSYWQSEDLAAVVDGDAQRTIIQHGPVAARYSVAVDEPVKDILDGIYRAHVQALLDAEYAGDASRVPEVASVGDAPAGAETESLAGVATTVSADGSTIEHRLGRALPSHDAWLRLLGGARRGWLQALLGSVAVVRDAAWAANPVRRLLRPRAGQTVTIEIDTATGAPQALSVSDAGDAEPRVTVSRDASSGDIVATVFHRVPLRGSRVALPLEFAFDAQHPLAPIRQHTDRFARAAQSLFESAWVDSAEPARAFTDMTDSDAVITGPGFLITADHARAFARNIGDRVWTPRADPLTGRVPVPLDYVHMPLIPDILCVLGASNIGGGQLEVVHTDYSYRLLDDAPAVSVGDRVTTELTPGELSNSASGSGRLLVSAGKMFCNGRQIGEMRSTCLGLNRRFAPERMVRRVSGEHFVVAFASPEDARELLLKEWFHVHADPSAVVAAGSVVEFRLDSVYRFKSDTVYSTVRTTGHATLLLDDQRTVPLGTVDYAWANCAGNQVTDYLAAHRAPPAAWMFPSGGYAITGPPRLMQCTVPPSNLEYSVLGGDRNPIHINEYVADVAGLPGALTQGLWTCAAARAVVELHAADGETGRLRAFDIECVGMVLPRDTLAVDIAHRGMDGGRMLVAGSVTNVQSGVVVVKYAAEIEQPRTAFVFTGQGSQSPGMGMDLYAQSEHARRVWDRADRHMRARLGVSLLDVVRSSPDRLTVRFGGSDSGVRVRANYLALSSAAGADDCAPLFPGIRADSGSFTFAAPASGGGLLNATQFTQPALAVLAVAAVADMRAHSLVPRRAALFAGHSLGELAALAALGNGLLSVEEVVDIAFYRGMLMQAAVPRDADSAVSGFAMVSANPARVASWFGHRQLADTVAAVRDAVRAADGGSGLLEIANHNIRGQQYVVSGAMLPLAALRLVLDAIAAEPAETLSIADTVTRVLGSSEYAALARGSQTLGSAALRGAAIVPLSGIDVPFHSSQLLPCVPRLRALLQSYVKPANVDIGALQRHYVPNLTAQPFEVSREYAVIVHELTQSPVLRESIDAGKWPAAGAAEESNGEAEELKSLAAELVIELLAYQIASPVQWIDTQDLLEPLCIRRVVEVGASPVLCGMATKTLAGRGFMPRKIDVLHVANDRETVYYLDRKSAPASEAAEKKPKAEEAAPAPAAPAAPVAAAAPEAPAVAPTPAPAAAPASFDDEPPRAIDVIASIAARKFKIELETLPLDKSIKSLAAGKSTLQNEIFGDLHKEFAGKLPSKAEDLVITELAATVDGVFDGQLGKHTQAQLTRLFSSKMPGGFALSAARTLLQARCALGPGRQDAVLLYALASEPKARLAGEAEAAAWLAELASRYAKRAGISLGAPSSAGAGGASAAAGGPMVSGAEVAALQKKQTDFALQQMQVLARYAGVDLSATNRLVDKEKTKSAGLQSKLDMLETELGDDFTEGIAPRFDAKMARHFDSYWSWARQDAFDWIQQTLVGGLKNQAQSGSAARIHRVRCCADSSLLSLLDGSVKALEAQDPSAAATSTTTTSENHQSALALARTLRDACAKALKERTLPAFKEMSQPMRPQTKVLGDGAVEYKEVLREGEPSFAEYAQKMMAEQKQEEEEEEGGSDKPATAPPPPYLYLKTRSAEDPTRWTHNRELSAVYYAGLAAQCGGDGSPGLSFADKTALVTGCGKGSIGFDVVRGLLAGGAKVLATTSSYSRRTIQAFEQVYRESGARGSELIVVPFNQGSAGDTRQLVEYVFGQLGWEDIDYVVPFAAVSDIGSFATSIGSRSEFSQRVMLTNVIRLLGGIKDTKEKRGLVFRPSLVVLPLSPNHGTFGGDGLYGECKAALETLLNRWQSEHWREYMAVAGTFIGWVRGTGLMAGNNHIAPQIESHGARTYTTREMAFNILALMNPKIHALASAQVICAEFDGRLGAIRDLSRVAGDAKYGLEAECSLKRLAYYENIQSLVSHYGDVASRTKVAAEDLFTLAQHESFFPQPRSYASLEHLRRLEGAVNLDKVVVITGYGEVGPYGHAETRWQMEAFGELTMAGCIELAWIMGLIKHFNGPLPGKSAAGAKHYVGWVDAKSGEPVRDDEVKARYLEFMMAHTGVRLIEPDLSHGYDPHAKVVLREVQIEHDMDAFEASSDDAHEYKKSNGDRVDIWETSGGAWSVRFRKGAVIRVPAAVSTDRLVAGLIPTGWTPTLFGIPEDLAKQIDMVTMYTLVATVEALVRSGITDPYELYKHFHVSQVGNSIGSGAGGGISFRHIFKSRLLEQEANSDVLQEVFISTIQAWVNMLLMSCSGPVKPVVGACATGLLSIDVAIETIQAGKAKVMLAGGVEDFGEENSVEFANMGATNNSLDDFATGRTPAEGSRPCTTTRNGFVESQGAGVVVLMSAAAALEFGAPIYGIVGMNEMASDKQGRSVPAPGQGILSFAQEKHVSAIPPRILDFDYRKQKLRDQIQALELSMRSDIDQINDTDDTDNDNNKQLAVSQIAADFEAAKRSAQDLWFNEFWRRRPDISPVRGSLSVWGLTVDDIGMASFHATSTVANDKNESEVVHKQFKHLGRTPGNA
ncbi:fatty acid synthase alpha subunit Lsd1, partial [Coemansia sp. RSA 2049]